MNKRALIIVSVSILVFIIILVIVYYMGKRAKQKASQTKVGSDEAGTTVLTQAEIDKLKALAIALHNDMDGINFSYQDDLYEKMNLLSDTQLVALSNIFNVMYESESGETFLQWFDGEYWKQEGILFSEFILDLKKRMVNLGIS